MNPMRVILLVLDGVGIGENPDVWQSRPQDQGAHTLRSLRQNIPDLYLKNLARLGLEHALAARDGLRLPDWQPAASYGRSRLAHPGADSYLGHQEIMGTIPKRPALALMSQVVSELEGLITSQGYQVRRPLEGKNLLLVNEAVIVGDNLEGDPVVTINLTVATDHIPFDEALRIGKIVRQAVYTSRVIVFGGPGIDANDILDRVQERANGQIGVDSPSLGVYNKNLHVVHLGYGVDPDQQAASILSRHGVRVVLIGKMADLIICPEAHRNPVVPTALVMQATSEARRQAALDSRQVFIAATVQETDLAAHEGDYVKLAAVLEEADRGLETLLAELSEEDVLIICADHGNDPQINVGKHTREETPLLIYQKGQPCTSFGVRATLADIGATITHLFNAPPTQDGSVIEYRRNI